MQDHHSRSFGVVYPCHGVLWLFIHVMECDGGPVSVYNLTCICICRQLRKVEEVQSALNNHGAMLKVLGHLSKTGDDIVREVLAFIAAMLFGGNENVQVQ